MSIIDRLIISITSVRLGADQLGNSYYESRFRKNYLGHKIRYVLYHGLVEASKIPPQWHAWLHYMTDKLPDHSTQDNYKWQKNPLPNLTGTKFAYLPINSKSGKRKNVSSDYMPWYPGGSK